MTQSRKPASLVTRKEFDALARKVETAGATLREDRKRITALEKSDHDLEERMNRKFVEMNMKIDAIGASQQEVSSKIDALVKGQDEANASVKEMLGDLLKLFRIDEGEEALGRAREGVNFLYKFHSFLESGKGFAFNAIIGLAVTGIGSLIVAGVLSYVGVKP